MAADWNKVDKIAEFLFGTLGPPPKVAVVLGSGLGDVGAGLANERSVSFGDIPDWPKSTVAGHSGVLRRGVMGGTEVVLQLGRIHLYEGYDPADVVLPVRALIAWGAKTVFLTNAAGGINEGYKAGSLMMIEDHINLTGRNPLIGPNDEARGPRFPDMTEIYDHRIRANALDAATRLGIQLHLGIYAGLTGPSYETPAEIGMLRKLGADAVGMSTVLEAIAAKHMGAQVAGISCITNQAATKGATLSHDEVRIFAARAATDMTRLIITMLGALGN
jgi:purine-nucleoside phosphorylase